MGYGCDIKLIFSLKALLCIQPVFLYQRFHTVVQILALFHVLFVVGLAPRETRWVD